MRTFIKMVFLGLESFFRLWSFFFLLLSLSSDPPCFDGAKLAGDKLIEKLKMKKFAASSYPFPTLPCQLLRFRFFIVSYLFSFSSSFLPDSITFFLFFFFLLHFFQIIRDSLPSCSSPLSLNIIDQFSKKFNYSCCLTF